MVDPSGLIVTGSEVLKQIYLYIYMFVIFLVFDSIFFRLSSTMRLGCRNVFLSELKEKVREGAEYK